MHHQNVTLITQQGHSCFGTNTFLTHENKLTAPATRLDLLAGKFRGFVLIGGSWLCLHAGLNLGRHGHECLLNVRGILGGSFQEFDSDGFGKVLRRGYHGEVRSNDEHVNEAMDGKQWGNQ